MTPSNFWKELFVPPANCTACSINDQADTLERVASFADYQSDRLSSGIAAISELLDSAVSADQVDDVVAVQICWLLTAIAGLSVQLATMSRDANRKLADTFTTGKSTFSTSAPHPLIQD